MENDEEVEKPLSIVWPIVGGMCIISYIVMLGTISYFENNNDMTATMCKENLAKSSSRTPLEIVTICKKN